MVHKSPRNFVASLYLSNSITRVRETKYLVNYARSMKVSKGT